MNNNNIIKYEIMFCVLVITEDTQSLECDLAEIRGTLCCASFGI